MHSAQKIYTRATKDEEETVAEAAVEVAEVAAE